MFFTSMSAFLSAAVTKQLDKTIKKTKIGYIIFYSVQNKNMVFGRKLLAVNFGFIYVLTFCYISYS